MQLLDPGRRVEGAPVIDQLAATFSVAPAQAQAALREVEAEFAWHLQRTALSRGGLADLVDALGSGQHARAGGDFANGAVNEAGGAILLSVLGSKDRGHALAARAARHANLTTGQAEAMLPALAAVAMANLSERSRTHLDGILAQVPPQGRWSRGSPHADLSDIMRRRCGAGAYSPRALPKAVRRALGRAAGFGRGGVGGWYVRFMLLRPIVQTIRTLVRR